MGADKGLSFDFLPELKVCEIHCRKLLQYHSYSTGMPHLVENWKISTMSFCEHKLCYCTELQCGVVHFLPSEAVIIGASLRAAKWGRQKTGEEVGRWTGGAFMEILTETVHHGTAAQAN